MTEQTHLVGTPGASAEIADGRLTMQADADDAAVYVAWPELTPLSGESTHARLYVASDDVDVEVALDAERLDALADAVHHAQEHHEREGNDGDV